MPTIPFGAQMTAAAGSEIPVGAPVLEEPVTGMLAQVPVVTGPDADRWFAGMSFSPEVSGQPEFRDLCSAVALAGTANREAARTVQPFELVLRDRCSTFGWQAADYEGRATRGLAVKRHWGVEREFEKGELIATNLHLADAYTAPEPTTVTLGGGVPVSPEHAMGLLDEAIGNSTNVIGRGMIFATPFVGALWAAAGLLSDMETEDGRTVILSPAGNYVVIGGGFEGRGPAGTVPAAHAGQWAYATDPVVVVASSPTTVPSTLAEATEKETNTVVYRQHQWFAVLWAGLLHAAVQVSTATPADSGGSDSASTNTTVYFAETSDLLDPAEVIDGASHAANGYSRFRAFAASDQDGTLSIQQSSDGVTWHTTLTQAVTGGTPAVLESIVAMAFVRASYLNGATLQTDFEFSTALVAI